MSLLRRVLGIMPKRQFTAVCIAGLLIIVSAGGVLGANSAATGLPSPDLITLVEQDITNGTMNASEFQTPEVPRPDIVQTVMENPRLNRLFTPLVKLGFYPAQAGSMVGYWSVNTLGRAATWVWLNSTIGAAVVVPIGHAARVVMLND